MAARKGDEGGFKVVDRRRFKEDGTPVPEEPAAEESPRPRTAPPDDRPAEASPRPGGAAAAGSPGRPEAEIGAGPQRRADAATTGDLPPPSFASLVQMLGLYALEALGAVPGPDGGVAAPDPALARHSIDLLAVLEEKTRGNLTPEESRMLEQTLFDLRMLAVRVSRSARP
jgi:hypothetical protein